MNRIDARPKFRSITAVVLASGLALSLAACGGADDSGGTTAGADLDPHAPELSSVSGSMYENPISAQWILAEPFAEDYGLTLEHVWQTDGAAGLAQLVSEDIDILQAAPARVADASIEGVELRIIAGTYESGPDFSSLLVMPDSGITDLADLEGKSVGMPSPVGIWGNRLRKAVADAGIDPESVTMVQVPFGDAAASLQRGTVDAVASQGAVTEQLTGVGATQIFDFGAGEFEGRAENVWAVTKKFLEQNPNTVAAFQCAILQGGEQANTRENVEGYFRDTLGWDDATIDATASVVAVAQPLTVEQVQQDFDDLVELGIESQSFDMSSIMVAQPDNC